MVLQLHLQCQLIEEVLLLVGVSSVLLEEGLVRFFWAKVGFVIQAFSSVVVSLLCLCVVVLLADVVKIGDVVNIPKFLLLVLN